MPRIVLGLLLLLLIAGCGSDESPPTPAVDIITPTAVVANVPTVTASPTRVVLTWVTATTTATVPSPASATVTAPEVTPPPTVPPIVTPPPGETAPVACSWPSGWVAHRVAAGDTVDLLIGRRNVEGGPRNVAQAIEATRLCAALREKQSLTEFGKSLEVKGE